MKFSKLTLFSALVLFLTVGGGVFAAEIEEVTYTSGSPSLTGYLFRPMGNGPCPAVLYNHGGVGMIIGGAPEETCEALAKAGFVGFSPIRRQTRSLRGHPGDVRAGLNYLRGLDTVDGDRVAMMGFSRGGVLTFMTAATDAPIKAAIIMAGAAPPPRSGFTLSDAGKIKVPTLLMVAENDTGSRKTLGQNTLEGMQRMAAALENGGNPARLIVYPSYGNDGHEMFFEIGKYWSDVVAFLKAQL